MVELSAAQRESILATVDSTAPVVVWDGSVRAGKTVASELAWLKHVRSGPRGPLLMVGKTLDTLERNVLQPLMDMLPPGAMKHTRLSTTARIFDRLVYVLGAGDKTAENRIRGLTLAGAYVDEASLLPDNFWPMLRTRLSVDGAKLLCTTNPDNPNHWLKRQVIDKADELGFLRFAFRLDDNPALPAAYVRQLKAEMHGLFYRRYIDGEWVAAEGAVYDMLDLDAAHRVTWANVPRLEAFLLGVDVGTTNPTHAVLLGAGEDQRLYVVAEWRWDSRTRQRQLTDAQQEQRLRDWLLSGASVPAEKLLTPRELARRHGSVPPIPVHPARIGVDPVAASFRAQLANAGWSGIARPGADTVIDGIRMVSSLLGSGRLLFVDGAAPELEQEMTGYAWDEAAAERGRDEPLKDADHGPDALRYAVTASRYLWRSWVTVDLGDDTG